MPQTHRFIQVIFLFVISLVFGGCGGVPVSNSPAQAKAAPRTTGSRGGKITYRLTAPPKTFNYLLAADEPSIVTAFFMLTDRLVDFDHESQKFVPGLAESWTAGSDGKTVRVKLRDGLKFSDGHSLTSDDVIFTLNAMYDDRTMSPVFRDSMLVDDKQIETKKISDTELDMIFPQPVASIENYLTNLGVLPAHILSADLAAGKLAESWKINAAPASIVSSGPFVVESAVPGERITFARNPNYWKHDTAGTQLPYLDNMTIEIVPDANNTFVRLQQGAIDLADRVRPSDFAEISKNGGQVSVYDAGPGLGIDHLFFNLNLTNSQGAQLNPIKRAWFADKRFRQAVAAAVDRETIAAVTLQGLASPLYGFVSPANKVWMARDMKKIDYNLASAEQMLKDAGFQKGGTKDAPVLTDSSGNAVEFTIVVPAENEPRTLMAGAVQEDLARLGIKVQVVPIEFAAVTEKWSKTFDYEAILLGLSQTDIEPSSYGNFLLSSASTHAWQPSQKQPSTDWERRIDDLFAQQSVERDQAKRFAQFSEIQTIMRDEMPVVPIVARHVVAAANTRVRNLSPSAILPYSLWNVDELFIGQ